VKQTFLILNLGCGMKPSPKVRNIDWSMCLRIGKNPLLMPLAMLLMSAPRRERLRSLRGLDIVVHNLARGIPAADGTVDMVYHSHLLEHLDREIAEAFLSEVHRVLKPGGIVRVVVPDLELYVRKYLASLEASLNDPAVGGRHDQTIAALYEQSVRREAAGTAYQRPIVRTIERLLVGDARKRGETHQWMYDRVNLRVKLEKAKFRDVTVHAFDTSAYSGWNSVGLDRKGDGPANPDSLYIEAVKI